MRTSDRSKALYERACKVMPGGVNSPVRAFRAVGATPVFIERGEGPYIYDADGNRYIDYVGEAPHSFADIVHTFTCLLPPYLSHMLCLSL